MSTIEHTRVRLVRVVWILLVLTGLAGALIDVGLLTIVKSATLGADASSFTIATVVVALVLAVAQAASGVFVRIGADRARRAAIGICGLNIVAAALTVVAGAGAQALIGIAVNIVIIGLLFTYRTDLVST